MAQRVLVEFRPTKAFFPCKAAAKHFVHLHHVTTTARGDHRQLVDRTHLAQAAHGVNRHGPGDCLDADSWQDEIVDELDAVLHGQTPGKVSLHPIGARTGIEYDWKLSISAGVAQGGLEFRRLVIGRLEKTLAL